MRRQQAASAMQSVHDNFTTSSEPFSMRRFEARDREAVLALWPADVMHSLPGLETIDVLINSLDGAIAGKHHVWVAETSGRIVGSAAIIHNDASLAHLRYLCVAAEVAERQVVARGLAQMAIRDAYNLQCKSRRWRRAGKRDRFHRRHHEDCGSARSICCMAWLVSSVGSISRIESQFIRSIRSLGQHNTINAVLIGNVSGVGPLT